jgi:MFS family permease
VGERLAALRRVAQSSTLRRLALAYAGFSVAEYATWLAVLVYAFDRGGVRESGVVAVVLLLPALVVAPLAAFAGDRFRPHRAMAVGYATQSLTTAAVAVAMVLDAPLGAYAAAAAATAAISFTRPVMGALLPLTCVSPADLIAANVAMGVIANLGLFLGPLAAAALLAVSSPTVVFVAAAGVLALCTVSAAALRLPEHVDEARPAIDSATVASEVLGGLVALRRSPSLAAIVGLVALGSFASGVFDVLVVVFADERLDAGGGVAGLLAGAVGLGALVGAGAAVGVVGGGRLMPLFALTGALIGTPIVIVSFTDRLATSLVLLAVAGAGLGLLSVIGSLAVQRRSPVRYRGRIFGALEGLQTLALAAGALAISTLVDAIGLDRAMASLGFVVAAAMIGGSALYVRLAGDVRSPPADLIGRLQHDGLLKYLELPAIEQLAGRVLQFTASEGSSLVVEGNTDDGYYLIVAGSAVVTRGGSPIAQLGVGDSFGEIAALRGIARTATVTATSTLSLLLIKRLDFLEAVNGHSWSIRTANEVVDSRLTT